MSAASLVVEPLTADAFVPFGRVLEQPARGHDAAGPGWRWWAETALLEGDGRPWGVGWLELEPTEARFDWAERHIRTIEVVLATHRDLFVYVGPAEHPDQPDRIAALDRFRVFRVPAGRGVALDRGVWHGAPFAVDGPTSAIVLLLQGTGRGDVTIVRFPETPLEFEGASSSGPPSPASTERRG